MKDIINTHSQFLTNYYSKTSAKIVVLDILWKIGNYFERHKAYCNTKYLIWLYPYSTNNISNDCKAYENFHCYYKMRVILFLLKTIYAYIQFLVKIFTSIARPKRSWSWQLHHLLSSLDKKRYNNIFVIISINRISNWDKAIIPSPDFILKGQIKNK